MNLISAVLSGFVLAGFAPLVDRRAPKVSGWVLALLPAALAVYFAALAPGIWGGEVLAAAEPWAPAIGLYLAFRLDGLSLLFALLITAVGALVTVYSGGYLEGHPQSGRFYAWLLVFMASMLGVVLADNLILIFVFWELTSLSSYFLIGFDHDREAARRSALQALLVTGIGGLALLAGFLLLAEAGGSLEAGILLSRGDAIRSHAFYLPALVLILLGAFTKSAQFPFHFWLPAAMEAPSPVSAYLHAATMVKAGVYLVARLTPALGGTDTWFIAVTVTGAVTMLAGALLAMGKKDLKQILAYSTVSVLGILTFLIGLGAAEAFGAMAAYLIAHCMYKGALFLYAGIVEHETRVRDVTLLSGMAKTMPLTAGIGLAAAVSMAGLPPAFGFVAKEAVYAAGLSAPALAHIFTAVLVGTATLFFALAAVVAVRPVFGAASDAVRRAHDPKLSLWLAPALLAGGGVWFGLGPGQLNAAVRSAVEAMGRSYEPHLALFHGWNPALLLTVLTVAGGAAAYALHRRTGGFSGVPLAGRWGPGRGYELALRALTRLAAVQTRLLQSGYLRYYVLAIVVTTVGLAGGALLWRSRMRLIFGFADVQWHEAAIVLVILAAILTAVLASSRLASVAALGAVGFGVALVFALFGAPDLAMTQFIIETLTVVLLVLVLHHLPDFSMLTGRKGRLRDAAIAICAGALMTALVMAAAGHLPASISRYFVENSYSLAEGRNVVNVILTDFRALDTLGEITVLAIAGVGVYALFRLRPANDGER